MDRIYNHIVWQCKLILMGNWMPFGFPKYIINFRHNYMGGNEFEVCLWRVQVFSPIIISYFVLFDGLFRELLTLVLLCCHSFEYTFCLLFIVLHEEFFRICFYILSGTLPAVFIQLPIICQLRSFIKWIFYELFDRKIGLMNI